MNQSRRELLKISLWGSPLVALNFTPLGLSNCFFKENTPLEKKNLKAPSLRSAVFGFAGSGIGTIASAIGYQIEQKTKVPTLTYNDGYISTKMGILRRNYSDRSKAELSHIKNLIASLKENPSQGAVFNFRAGAANDESDSIISLLKENNFEFSVYYPEDHSLALARYNLMAISKVWHLPASASELSFPIQEEVTFDEHRIYEMNRCYALMNKIAQLEQAKIFTLNRTTELAAIELIKKSDSPRFAEAFWDQNTMSTSLAKFKIKIPNT